MPRIGLEQYADSGYADYPHVLATIDGFRFCFNADEFEDTGPLNALMRNLQEAWDEICRPEFSEFNNALNAFAFSNGLNLYLGRNKNGRDFFVKSRHHKSHEIGKVVSSFIEALRSECEALLKGTNNALIEEALNIACVLTDDDFINICSMRELLEFLRNKQKENGSRHAYIWHWYQKMIGIAKSFGDDSSNLSFEELLQNLVGALVENDLTTLDKAEFQTHYDNACRALARDVK